MALPEELVSEAIDKESKPVLGNGDTFDEDSGEFLGTLTDASDNVINLPPANMSIYIEGYWYIYKMDSKVKAEERKDGQEEKSG